MVNEKLKDIIDSLEIKLMHLKNDYFLIKQEYEVSTEKYLEMLSELKESEKKHRELVQTIPECVYSSSSNNEILYMSPAVENIFGYSAEEFIDDKNLLIRRIYKDDKNKTLIKLKKLFKKGIPYVHEFRFKKKDGNIVWIRDHAKAILDYKGNPIKITGIIYDITERKRAEEALKKSQKKLEEQKLALEHKNIALSEVIKQIEIEKNEIKDSIILNVNKTILPILKKLRLTNISNKYIDMLQFQIEKLISSFNINLIEIYVKLTSRETEICTMIESSLTNKEISKLLNISQFTVENHRKNIRKKLGIINKKINLSSFLKQLSSQATYSKQSL